MRLRATLAAVAPGTALRDGLERILRGRTGALIVLGYDKRRRVDLCTGGFPLDVEFAATGLRELAKMDGAIVLDRDVTRILRGRGPPGARPVDPDRGDRHPPPHRRAGGQADRLPGDLGVSQSMQIIAAVRRRDPPRARGLGADPVPGQPGAGHPRALQAAARRGRRHAVRAGDRGPGHRPRRRRRSPSGSRWCAGSPARSRATSLELGTDGRLLSLQLEELIAGVEPGARAGRPRLPARRRRRSQARPRPRPAPSSRRCRATELRRPRRPSPARSASARGEHLDGAVAPARLPAAGQGAAAARRPSSTGWSSTSAACRSCSPPASTTCRRSRASASSGPAACARACPGWPSPRSSSATSEPGQSASRRGASALLAGAGAGARSG